VEIEETVSQIMSMTDAKVVVLLIASIAGGLVSLIGAIAAAIAVIRAGKIHTKTEEIHTLVNSALDKEKLRGTMLEALLLAKDLEIANMEKARLALAATPVMTVPVTIETTPPTVIVTPGERSGT